MRISYRFLCFIFFTAVSACNPLGLIGKKTDNNTDVYLLVLLSLNRSDWVWDLPPGFPIPTVPSDNPMTRAKVELGRHLFNEKRLSGDRSMSCGSCHIQSLAFSDGKQFPTGITNEAHPRNSQHLSNVVYQSRLTWNNPQMVNLEIQSRVPLFGESPVELGLSNNEYLQLLKSDQLYRNLFTNAYGNADSAVTEQNIRFALSSFQRSMISGRSPFDNISNRQSVSISSSQVQSINRGNAFFNSEVAECFHCHGGFNFTDTNLHSGQVSAEFAYHNNGTHTKAFYDALPLEKQGLKAITLLETDQGKFKAPSLRNIGLTFPYMHDGSIMCDDSENPKITLGKTIESCARNALGKVLEQYKAGGLAHPAKDGTLIRPFLMSDQEKADMINFLLSLTDEQFINDRAFSNPFPK
jgi:cytochrome c peroxidase